MNVPLVSMQDLSRAALGEVPCASIALPDGQLRIERILRHLPGKRLVFSARWHDQSPVAVKLFFGEKEAKRGEQEARRQGMLCSAGVLTPEPLAFHDLDGGAAAVTRWCSGRPANSLTAEESDVVFPLVLNSVFNLYELGWLQRDLHLGNFLYDEGRVWVIDAGDIDRLPAGRKRTPAILDNLALLCAQGDLAQVSALVKLVAETLRARGVSAPGFRGRVHRRIRKRVCSAMKKWRRASTAIDVQRDQHGEWLWQRSLPTAVVEYMRSAVLSPSPSASEIIKKGSRITVCRNGDWVVKHYHQGGLKAKLKQHGFRGRADISWVQGWTWALLGVPTPRPAMLLRKPGGQGVVVFPYVEAVPLSELMKDDPRRAKKVAPRARRWLELLHGVGFWHGDTKAQNALVDGQNDVHWIDLDSAGFTCQDWRRSRKAKRELARFDRNWKQFAR